MHELKLADLGEGMHEAEIVEWLVKEGESVKLDQPVVRVETDKAIVEIPSPIAGRVSKVCFQPGQMAKVGEVLVIYDIPSTQNGSDSRSQAVPPASTSMQSPQASTTTKQAVSEKRRVLAAPAVRKLAFELGIDLAEVTPSANGRITIDDVRSHAQQAKTAIPQPKPASPSPPEPKPASPPLSEPKPASPLPSVSIGTPVHTPAQPTTEDERQPLTGLRKRIAEHMERSWRTIPHATAFDELNASALIALRQTLSPLAEKRGTRLTYIPLLIKLLIPVLKEFPIFNASLDEEKREIIYKRAYHLGVATATPEGLLVPVLRDADKLSIIEIATQLERLIEGAKKRTLTLNELSGSTFTLNNIGSFGGTSGTPIINYPEVAILAIGKIEEKAIVHNGTLLAQPRLPLALSFDHRLIDGAQSGAFLARFKELVEQPQQLMLNMI
jgi:pyruvate dehydrogenase E2 component (dihydrolipoamide acetyltransferase)